MSKSNKRKLRELERRIKELEEQVEYLQVVPPQFPYIIPASTGLPPRQPLFISPPVQRPPWLPPGGNVRCMS